MTSNRIQLEVEGENSVENIKNLLNVLALNDSIDGITVEIHSDHPIETVAAESAQEPREAVEAEADPEVVEDDAASESAQESVEEAEIPDVGDDDVECIFGVRPENVPSLRGSGTLAVLDVLDSDPEKFWHTPEIRNHIDEFDGFNPDSVSQLLWELSDRGLVDKQDSDRDKRMKKYKITSKGRAAAQVAADA